MTKAIIYFDGGSYNKISESGKVFSASYGVILHNGSEEPIERYGEYVVDQNNNNRHEIIAFIEAYKLLKEKEINYRNVSFYTDCEDIAYASMHLHKENYSIKQENRIKHLINSVCSMLNMKEEEENILDCLKNSRFIKVKSHDATVDNIRVDYLSKMAHKKILPLSYDKFLAASFVKFDSDGAKVFNLPFMPKNNNKEERIHIK